MNVSLEKWLSRERLLIQPQRSSQVGFVLAKYLEHEISYPKGRLTNSLFRGKKRAFLKVAYWLLTDKWKRFDMIARDDGRKSQTGKKYMCALRWRVLSIWSTFLLWYLLVFYISPRSMKWQYNVRGCLDLKLSQTKSSNFETIVNFAFMANRWYLFF